MLTCHGLSSQLLIMESTYIATRDAMRRDLVSSISKEMFLALPGAEFRHENSSCSRDIVRRSRRNS